MLILVGSLRPRSGLWPRPTPICCPYTATRPHHSTQKLSPACATETMERMGEKNTKGVCEKPMCRPSPSRMRRNGKKEKVRMSLTLLCIWYRVHWPIADPSRSFISAAAKPQHPWRRPRQQPGRPHQPPVQLEPYTRRYVTCYMFDRRLCVFSL